MSCYSPILVKDPRFPSGKVYMPVPCGKCIGCLKVKQASWSIRVKEEMRSHPCNCFLTLTYRDDSVPTAFDEETGSLAMTLDRTHIQNFVKQLRNCFRDEAATLKTFYCGEYGSRTFRPHYHLVCIGKTSRDIEPALSYWRDRYGFVNVQDIGVSASDSAAVGLYVGKYSSKGIFSFQDPRFLSCQVNPFIESSIGLGAKWIDDRLDYFSLINENSRYRSFDEFMEDFVQNFRYRSDGFNYAMPRYYKNRFFSKCDGASLLDSIKRKVGEYAPFDPKIYEVQTTSALLLEGGTKKQVPVTIPSIRDAVTNTILRIDDRLFNQLCAVNGDSEGAYTIRKMVDEKQSLSDSLTFRGAKALDAAYLRSKV